MALLNGLLPIIEKKEKSNSSRPITAKDKESIYTLLNEEVRLERFASQSINKDPNASQYFLEPIPHELFDIYQYEENATMQPATNDALSLIPVGKLNLFDDSDSETVDLDNTVRDESAAKPFDMAAYQARRRKQIEKQNTIESLEESSPVPTTPGLSVDTPMMARSSIAQLPTATVAQTVVPAVSTQQQQQKQQVQQNVTEEYQPNTQEVEDMVNQVLNGKNDDMMMTEAGNELEAAVTTAATITAATMDTQHKWYSDEEIMEADSSAAANLDPTTRKNIYGFLKQVIPIYATNDQQTEYDKITLEANTKNTSTSTDFKKLVDALNFPNINLDLALEEHWATSGKTVFIKRLLTNLSSKDIIIVFATSNLNDEANLIQMLSQSLRLTCLRVGSLLDEIWDGEYGVIVKTQDKSDTNTTSTQKQQQFTAHADLIVCLDVRISSKHSIFSKIAKRGATSDDVPPIAWLISIGSIEDHIFSYLKSAHVPLSEEVMKSALFKSLVKMGSKWPDANKEEFNLAVADNVKSWLLSASVNMNNYQYRSTLALPKANVFAYIKPEDATTSAATTGLLEDSTVVDMEVDSDAATTATQEEPPVLSDQLKAYINDCLIPPFDVNLGQLMRVSRADKFLSLLDSDKKVVESLRQKVYVDYCDQVNTLKRQYEVAFKELQGKYLEKAFEVAATELKK